MKKERVQIIILLLLLVTIASYLFYSYAMSPKLQQIREQKNQIAEQRERLAFLQAEAQRQEEHEQRVQELQQEYQVLKEQIPPVLSKQQLIYYFYNICAEFGISDGVLSFGEAVTEGGYAKLSISFSGLGTVTNVLALCEELQRSSNPRITVDSISVNPEILTASFNMNLFGYSERLEANPDAEKEFMDAPLGITIPADIRPYVLDEADGLLRITAGTDIWPGIPVGTDIMPDMPAEPDIVPGIQDEININPDETNFLPCFPDGTDYVPCK